MHMSHVHFLVLVVQETCKGFIVTVIDWRGASFIPDSEKIEHGFSYGSSCIQIVPKTKYDQSQVWNVKQLQIMWDSFHQWRPKFNPHYLFYITQFHISKMRTLAKSPVLNVKTNLCYGMKRVSRSTLKAQRRNWISIPYKSSDACEKAHGSGLFHFNVSITVTSHRL